MAARVERFEFEELYRSYAPRVRRLAQRRTGDRELAEDLTQETFLRAYRGIDALEPDRPVWPWLATVAGNVCTDELRSRGSRPQHVSAPVDTAASPSPVWDPEARALAAERRHHMGETLRRMNPRHRRVLVRQSVEGWRYADIAQAEGLTVNSLKPLLTRARASFRHTFSTLSADGPQAFVLAVAARLRALAVRFGGHVEDGVGRALGTASPLIGQILLAASVALVTTGMGDVSTPAPKDAPPVQARASPALVEPAPQVTRSDWSRAAWTRDPKPPRSRPVPAPRMAAPVRQPLDLGVTANLRAGRRRTASSRAKAGNENRHYYNIKEIEIDCSAGLTGSLACAALSHVPTAP